MAVGVFVYGFIGWTVFASLTNWNSFIPDLSFAGLRNYLTLFDTPRFRIDLHNTAIFTASFLTGCLGIGLLLAIGLAVVTYERRAPTEYTSTATLFVTQQGFPYATPSTTGEASVDPGSLSRGNGGGRAKPPSSK